MRFGLGASDWNWFRIETGMVDAALRTNGAGMSCLAQNKLALPSNPFGGFHRGSGAAGRGKPRPYNEIEAEGRGKVLLLL